MFRNFLLFGFLLLTCAAARAQGGARLFWDIPSIHYTAPDIEQISTLMGVGAETAFNLGTHWSFARIGGGSTFTLNPQSEDVGGSFKTSPYALLEAGLGRYRSNGNQCAKTHQAAFSLLATAGIRYHFQPETNNLDYSVGAELGYFFIRDVFKNQEFFASANYFLKAKTIGFNVGFKLFLNLKADRDY